MRTLRTPVVAALGAALLALPAVALPSVAMADEAPGQLKDGHYDFIVIGDIPYGAAQIAAFPGMVDRINAEASVELAVHLGDIKNGSTLCTDQHNAFIKGQFDRFVAPLLYTPGDNEWTDCHRPKAGLYSPLERLAALRETFFANPTQTLGSKPINVATQAGIGFPENQSLHDQGIAFATLHIVGSNNDLVPWSGIGYTSPTSEQLAEEQARTAAAIAQVHDAFATARQRHDRAVVLFQQADMFDPTYTATFQDVSAFKPLIQAIVDESSTFDGEVYLFDGDSHHYNVDRPVAGGSHWLDLYGTQGSADNLTRITVDGEEQNTDFLKVTVNRPGTDHVLSWQRVPYAS